LQNAEGLCVLYTVGGFEPFFIQWCKSVSVIKRSKFETNWPCFNYVYLLIKDSLTDQINNTLYHVGHRPHRFKSSLQSAKNLFHAGGPSLFLDIPSGIT